MEQLCRYADIISFHLPLNEETFHFAADNFFKSLQQRPYIINSARGAIIQTGSLVNALKKNHVSGAALDVLENEKLDTYNQEEIEDLRFLNGQDNVLITPHIAGYSREAFYKMS